MFKFRLESIKKFKEHKEKICQDEVAKCLSDLIRAEKKKDSIEFAIMQLNDQYLHSQEKMIDLKETALIHDCLLYQAKVLILQEEIVLATETQLNNAKNRLMDAVKERKIIEKYEKKKYQLYLGKQNRLEQFALDELASQR